MHTKKRYFNSDVNIYEFNPRIEIIEPDFGEKGKLEILSKIGTEKPGKRIVCKTNATYFGGLNEYYGPFIKNGLWYGSLSKIFMGIIFTKGYNLIFDKITDLQTAAYWQGNAFWVIGGSFTLTLNGQISTINTETFVHFEERHPRTAIGQKANGNIILAVVDGRSKENAGVTGRELAEIMLDLGCVNSINLDGGGSSEMIIFDESTSAYKIVNKPSDGQERPIGAALIVYKEVGNVKKKVYISPSTQEYNIGAGNYGTEEKRMNEVADVVCALLEYNGFEVRRNKPEMTLSQVIADSDAWQPDIHVAIHSNAMDSANAGKARGCEVWAYLIKGKVTNSQRLAEAIYKELEPLTPTADRGIKDGVAANLAEVKTVKATSCIVEVAFHDNLEDAIWIINNIPQIGEAITRGICNYFGVAFKKPIDDIDWKAKYYALIDDIKNLLNKYEKGG